MHGAETNLVCILPSNKPVLGGCSVGSRDQNTPEYDSDYLGAVSADGSEVYWTDEATGRLYLRLSGVSTLAVRAGVAQFWGASSDGSRAIYSEGEKLRLFNLETGTSSTIATGFRGLLGASSDTSKLYFVSTEVLSSGATVGEPNLYLYENGEPGSFTYVATLSKADIAEEGLPFPASPKRHGHTAQVSPDGGTLIFMSAGRPTGFDNTDAENGEADTEVYLYRAGSKSLSCLSCSRGGSRPIGRDGEKEWRTSRSFWVAGQIPAGRVSIADSAGRLSGRDAAVFFESYDALSERDTNEQKDVYEWEAEGAGNCAPGVAGFDAEVGGCINLISSGESPQPSSIVDTDPTGRDVFFKTESSLLPQDTEAVDIYDAREGGGVALKPPVAEPCQGEVCRPTGSSSPGTSSTPTSTQVQSSGDLLRPRCRKGTHLVTKGGKNQCVKAEKHQKKKAQKKKHHKKQSQGKKHRHASKARGAGR